MWVCALEAAAWLRSRGAKTAETKLLFNVSKEEYEPGPPSWTSAYIYKGCAVAVSDELDPGMSVVLPMAANDLLTINGVDASFVAVAKNGGVNISARSMGALNVQVILEPLGGGGHRTMRASAQGLHGGTGRKAYPGRNRQLPCRPGCQQGRCRITIALPIKI